MRDEGGRRWRAVAVVAAVLAASLAVPNSARAGKLAWLDEVVQGVIREAEAGSRTAIRGADEVAAAAVAGRGATRLFAREGEEGLEVLVRRSDDLARAGRRGVEAASEAALARRFARLAPRDAEGAKVFAALAPAEKRLVVEMGETAQRLAVRYPGQAGRMVEQLGTEGLTAVRVFGDDVAEVLVKEGPDALNVLRKTGRGGWEFFTTTVLPHKKKLIAAGVMTAFLADPDRFVDYAGRATEFAVREFARAGVTLASAVGAGAARGLESSIAEVLRPYGLDSTAARYLGMALAGLAALWAALVLLGLPVRWMLRPVTWPLGWVLRRRKAPRVA